MILEDDPNVVGAVELDNLFDAFDVSSLVPVDDIDIGSVVDAVSVVGTVVVGCINVVVLITEIDKIYKMGDRYRFRTI